MEEKFVEFAEEKPITATALVSVGAAVVCMPLCLLLYKWLGATAGKSAAKELVRSGVFK